MTNKKISDIIILEKIEIKGEKIMAEKISISDLGLATEKAACEITVGNKTIEVKQYLPMEEKVSFVEDVLNKSGEVNYANPLKIEVFFNLALVEYYTNIGIDADKPLECYDLLEANGVFTKLSQIIPETEYRGLISYIDQSIKGFYDYKNSALGIMETISTDYSNLELNSEKIKDNLSDKNNLSMLKDVMTKLG